MDGRHLRRLVQIVVARGLVIVCMVRAWFATYALLLFRLANEIGVQVIVPESGPLVQLLLWLDFSVALQSLTIKGAFDSSIYVDYVVFNARYWRTLR